jgi:hypothetical protein
MKDPIKEHRSDSKEDIKKKAQLEKLVGDTPARKAAPQHKRPA